MSFCQVCRHESPGHEPNCPVLTGEPQPSVSWVDMSNHWAKANPEEARERCYAIVGELASNALETAYNALGSLQDCCRPQHTQFFRTALSELRELIDNVEEKLP